jgi:hypothetical protein
MNVGLWIGLLGIAIGIIFSILWLILPPRCAFCRTPIRTWRARVCSRCGIPLGASPHVAEALRKERELERKVRLDHVQAAFEGSAPAPNMSRVAPTAAPVAPSAITPDDRLMHQRIRKAFQLGTAFQILGFSGFLLVVTTFGLIKHPGAFLYLCFIFFGLLFIGIFLFGWRWTISALSCPSCRKWFFSSNVFGNGWAVWTPWTFRDEVRVCSRCGMDLRGYFRGVFGPQS